MAPERPTPAPSPVDILPPDHPQRRVLHDEVHARPPPRIRIPAFVVYLAVLNEGVSREAEIAHLRRLPAQGGLDAQPGSNFLHLRLQGHSVKWERHGEFTRYTVVQPLPGGGTRALDDNELTRQVAVDPAWLKEVPGRTVCAVQLLFIEDSLLDPQATLAAARPWFAERTVVASRLGRGHSLAVTDFHLLESGFERILVFAPAHTSPTRAGRISQRLLEIETYRLMALRGLPVAKDLAGLLGEAETSLTEITAMLEDRCSSEEALLDRLAALAARVERATAQHAYRFAATEAYARLVRERIDELREEPIAGTQTISEFMRRRVSPAIATVAATSQRLGSLSQRIERAGALLRTRVEIATERQNQELLGKLTRGQALQLQLQSTVEGLSIAAIAYYVVGLVLYSAKAAHSVGVPIDPEVAAGAMVPLVLLGAWRVIQRIHKRLQHQD